MSTMSTEAERALRKTAERIARLKKDPSFGILIREIEKKRDRMRNTLTARLHGGEEMATLQRQADYDRGFIEGALYPQTIVDRAAEKLQEWESSGEVTESEETDGWAGYE